MKKEISSGRVQCRILVHIKLLSHTFSMLCCEKMSVEFGAVGTEIAWVSVAEDFYVLNWSGGADVGQSLFNSNSGHV